MTAHMLTAHRSPLTAPTIALTTGEPAGIGPDLCILLAQQKYAGARIVVIADRELLADRARQLGVPFASVDFSPAAPAPDRAGVLEIVHCDLAQPVRAGTLNPANSRYVLETLTLAARGCLAGTFDAMVTGPVHKGVINDAGIAFTGHTEFLAELTGTPQVVMMLVGGGLRVALATTHLALQDVPGAITRPGLEKIIRILHKDLVDRFGIANPRILVAGLNPHAGESGHMGREEIEIIEPVLDTLRGENMNLVGPLPADTLFTRHQLEGADCQLAMYHDQGLPVLKFASFGGGVNVTLGMPIIRTSVDHGTALSLAGTGRIESGSLAAAIELALEMAKNGKQLGVNSEQ